MTIEEEITQAIRALAEKHGSMDFPTAELFDSLPHIPPVELAPVAQGIFSDLGRQYMQEAAGLKKYGRQKFGARPTAVK